ncbi:MULTISPECIES: hypothetical protein [Xanthomonas]|uniref:Uncharacterized protein n=1 Tax=Xanthomonas euvesicatoria TaxID=456327 RepID=A0AAX4FR14_XANEU|nr:MULTISPECIES: hypothetical protein [Xanthomonas]QYF47467.1 hypothetical protein HZS93_07024 [Xanthomonas citri]WOP50431.1 hypothetical protein R2B60_22385 [Xanthomonas euvesicatoria]WOP54605.1 hypothetical protein R5576_22270 [Xanthomonas euvesicatoria]WOP58898.1 hypothetical protein R5577_21655 [Xanthomonas euvesicatoria]
MQVLLLVMALASAPAQVVVELAPEVGTSATGQPIVAYDRQLAAELVRDLDGLGIPAAVANGPQTDSAARLTVRLGHHAIPAQWVAAGYAKAFYGYAITLGHSNPEMATAVSCARLIGTGLREVGEMPSLYRSMKLPGLDMPLVDQSLGIHRTRGESHLDLRTHATLDLQVGIVSHPDEARRLVNPVVVAGISSAIANGIQACFNPAQDENAE